MIDSRGRGEAPGRRSEPEIPHPTPPDIQGVGIRTSAAVGWLSARATFAQVRWSKCRPAGRESDINRAPVSQSPTRPSLTFCADKTHYVTLTTPYYFVHHRFDLGSAPACLMSIHLAVFAIDLRVLVVAKRISYSIFFGGRGTSSPRLLATDTAAPQRNHPQSSTNPAWLGRDQRRWRLQSPATRSAPQAPGAVGRWRTTPARRQRGLERR